MCTAVNAIPKRAKLSAKRLGDRLTLNKAMLLLTKPEDFSLGDHCARKTFSRGICKNGINS